MKKTHLVYGIFLLVIIGCQKEPETELLCTESTTIIPATSTSTGPSSTTTMQLVTTTTSLPTTSSTQSTTTTTLPENECKLVMFHNGKGPMCLEQLEFLEDIEEDFPLLIVEEYLTTEQSNLILLYEMESSYGESHGVSENFGYLPITFINNKAYSGFDSKVEDRLLDDIGEVCR
ncbi:hypothetical protein JW930_01370 [Candidatus Woesearchaeota archaeon]|nr:hypothetical protein [Candidatus Woesearchaeota archaeon]